MGHIFILIGEGYDYNVEYIRKTNFHKLTLPYPLSKIKKPLADQEVKYHVAEEEGFEPPEV